MNIFKNTFWILALVVHFSLQAAAAQSSGCDSCDTAMKSAAEIRALKYTNDNDRFQGGVKARAAVKQLQAFQNLPATDANRRAAFKNLLALVREAGPYDGESQLAEVLAGSLTKDSGLKAEYSTYLKSLPHSKDADSCKTLRMETSVAEQVCLQSAGVRGQDFKDQGQAAKAKSCIRPFNYDTCLQKASASPAKASPGQG